MTEKSREEKIQIGDRFEEWTIMGGARADNRRNNIRIAINGITKHLVEWSEIAQINVKTLYGRYYKGWRGYKLIQPTRKK